MPLHRVFRGQAVKCTRRIGSQVVVTFRRQTPTSPHDRVMLPLAEYLTEAQTTHRPSRSAGATRR